MPLEPPWPAEVLDHLRAALAVLRRAEQAEPRNPLIGAAADDVGAAIVKIEALARTQERTQE